jgi:hypothetical protein
MGWSLSQMNRLPWKGAYRTPGAIIGGWVSELGRGWQLTGTEGSVPD